jgi:DNA-binding MarR family transcriptional regulator
VVNSVPDDTQLEQLLTQLLRVVSPALGMQPPDVAGRLRPFPAGGGDSTDGPGTGADGGQAGDAAHMEAYAVPGRAAAGGAAGVSLPSVSGSEARALIELMSARGIAQGELAGLLALDKSTVSRLAAGLERKGWIRRGRDEENQRYVRLYLTAEGGQIAARFLQAWNSRQARILSALSEDERAGLSAGLRGLVRGLTAEGLLANHDGTVPG